MTRDIIFISHASPDDNDFVRWLGARLIGHGYKVWSDVRELRGGTPFWRRIEDALRDQTIKFIFVISKASIDRDRSGARDELSVADAVKKSLNDPDFIIPVRIDDTPPSDFPIQVHQLNAIDFSVGWGSKLIDLLDTLEAGRVPRSLGDQTLEFEHWRTAMVSSTSKVEISEERVLTNLLPVIKLPETITFFDYEGDNTKIKAALEETGIPHGVFNRHIIAFAQTELLQDALPPSFAVKVRARVPFADFLEGTVADPASPRRDEARKMVTFLLRAHIERYLASRGLRRFEASSGAAFYFPSGFLPGDKVPYLAATGRRTNKNVAGRSERNKVNWHLAMKVNVVIGPPRYVRFKPYVCFSEDGQTAISDPKRTSAIRRRFCRSWWNPQWRQLQEAFCAFLVSEIDEITIDLAGAEKLVLSGKLLELLAARTMPDDLKVAEEPDEPEETEDLEDDEDESFDPDDADIAEDVE
jgi:TIR domain